ncbi:MAG: Calx-beta domain-containing protein [Actinomycetota bacterium]
MKRRLGTLLAVLAFASPLGEAASACADAHMIVYLTNFPPEATSRPMYWAVEGDGGTTNVPFRIQLSGGDCSGTAVTVSYRTDPGTPNAADYVPAQGEVLFPNTGAHADYADRQLPVSGDLVADPPAAGVETATVVLFEPKNGAALANPSSVPVVIVDDDGPNARVSMLPGDYPHVEITPSGGIPVFMEGDPAVATTVDYAIAPDPGAPPTAGQDYHAAASGSLTFQPGDRMEMIPITVVNDGVSDAGERLRVSITGPSVVGGNQEVTFTITEIPGVLGPQSNLHHPRQRLRYRADDFRIREIHIFTTAPPGLQTIGARFALRRNMKNGSCAWLGGKRFRKGPCDEERWLVAGKYEADFFFYRLRRELRPSRGRIRTYTAFSRAQDSAGQVELVFARGRNANTFEVKPPKNKG